VVKRAERRQIRHRLPLRMPRAQDHHIGLLEKPPRAQGLGRHLRRHQRHVERAFRHLPGKIHRNGPHRQTDPGRLVSQPLQERQQDRPLRVIRGRNPQGQVRALRIEADALQDRLDLGQNGLERRRKFLGARRGQHAALGAHEKRVVQMGAQPGQHAADGGLRQAKPLRRARDRAGLEQRLKRAQEVQIEGSDISQGDTS